MLWVLSERRWPRENNVHFWQRHTGTVIKRAAYHNVHVNDRPDGVVQVHATATGKPERRRVLQPNGSEGDCTPTPFPFSLLPEPTPEYVKIIIETNLEEFPNKQKRSLLKLYTGPGS
jgi:hypothetical protein